MHQESSSSPQGLQEGYTRRIDDDQAKQSIVAVLKNERRGEDDDRAMSSSVLCVVGRLEDKTSIAR